MDPRESKRVLHLFFCLFIPFPLYEGAESWPGRRGCNVMWVSNMISSHSQLLLGCVTPTQSRPSVCVCVRLCARDSQANSTGVCTLIELKSKGLKKHMETNFTSWFGGEVQKERKKKISKRAFTFRPGCFLARNHLCTLLSHSRSGVDVLTRQSMTELYLISVFVFV